MRIKCVALSKRYQYNWIIRNCNWEFATNKIYGISGANGSGKSTLIQLISTKLSPSAGHLEYYLDDHLLPEDELYMHMSIAAPYTALIQEFTLKEQFDFHFKFKPARRPVSWENFLEILAFDDWGDKKIEAFSSGMHQRVQLALAILSASKLLLLDEPTSFLDSDARKWFYDLLAHFATDRIIILASNDTEDLKQCEIIYQIEELKAIS